MFDSELENEPDSEGRIGGSLVIDSLPRLQIYQPDGEGEETIIVILDGKDISHAVRSIVLDISAERYGTTSVATIELFVKAQIGACADVSNGDN